MRTGTAEYDPDIDRLKRNFSTNYLPDFETSDSEKRYSLGEKVIDTRRE